MRIVMKKRRRSLSGGTWYVGTVGPYYFEALVFIEGSRYGIDGGQVSKLYLLDKPRRQGGQDLACYDRGWDMQPKTPDAKAAVEAVVEETSRKERER